MDPIPFATGTVRILFFRRMHPFPSRRGAKVPRVRGGAAVARLDSTADLPAVAPAGYQPRRASSHTQAALPGVAPISSYYPLAPTLAIALLGLFAARLTELTPMLNFLRPTLLASIAALPLVLSKSARSVTTGVLRHPVFQLVAGYGLWALLTGPIALWPRLAVESAIGLFIPAIIICFVILACPPNARTVDRLAFGLVVAVMIHVSYLLVMGAARAGNRLTSEGSLDPNDLGSLVAMSFPLAAGLALRTHGRTKAIAITAVLIFVVTLMRTGSRGGTVAFAAATVVFVAGFPARRRWTLAIALLFAAPLAWTLGPPEYRERMRTMLSLEEDYNQTEYGGRKAVRERAQVYFKQHPVAGVGMFCFAMAEGQHNREIGRTGKWSAPHNAYWQALAELGLPGGAFFMGMIGSAIVYGLRCWRWRARDGTPSAFHRPEYLAAVVGFAIGAYFLSHAYFWPLFGLVALSGLAGLTARSPGAALPDAAAPTSRRRGMAAGGGRFGQPPVVA